MTTYWFGTVVSTAFKDDSGIYLNGRKVGIDNAKRGGYIRYADGFIGLDAEGTCIGLYNTTTPLIFVAYLPGCSEDDAYCEAMSAADCNEYITSISFDKKAIAESEGIELEQLRKMDGLLMKVEYEIRNVEHYDSSCTYAIC